MKRLHPALTLLALSSLAAAAPSMTPRQANGVTVRGQLIDAEKAPVVGFPLTAAVYANGTRLFETTVVTAAHGRYEVRLPPPPHLPGEPYVQVRVGIESDGYQARAKFRDYRGKHVQMPDLVVAEGSTAHLRVVGEDGLPVTARGRARSFDSASPRLGPYGPVAWEDPSQRPTIEWNPLTERYDVFFAEPVTAFAFVRYGKLGSALGELALDATKRGHEFSAVLRGGGTLAGTLRGPDGEPLTEVSLVAYPADWDSPYNPLEALLELTHGGLCKATARTERDGSFRFGGLQPGSYVIALEGGFGSPKAELERETFLLGTEGIELRLRAYRLVIEVRDEHGQPVEKDGVLCYARRGDREEKLYSRELGDGRFAFEVEPGKRYVYGWFEPDRPLVDGAVTIEEGTWTTRRRLELAAPVEAQTLTVSVRGEDGEPLITSFWSIGLELRSVTTGLLLADPRLHSYTSAANPKLSKTATETLRLAPGRYELGAIPGYGSGLFLCGDTPTPPLPCGPVRREVQVVPDRPSEVELRLWKGGRVHVFLDLPDDLRDPRLVIPEGVSSHDDWGRRNDLFITEDDNPCARIYWTDPLDGERKPLVFYAGTDDLSHSGAYEEVIPGTDFISFTLLPPGRHELEVRAPHFEPVTVSVEIRTDERTQVRVPLRY